MEKLATNRVLQPDSHSLTILTKLVVMKNNTTIRRFAAITICGLLPLVVAGQVPTELNGTWVIDPRQTAERLIAVGPPSNNAQWLPSIILRQCVTTLTFDGDTMIIDPISPAPTAQSFRLVPQQDRKLTFTVQTADGGKDTMTIAFLHAEGITVASEKVGLDEYGVWKRGKRPNRQTTEKDFKQAFDACASALDNVPFIKTKAR